MEHALLASVDELLAPASLSRLLGQPIGVVRTRPLSPEFAKSGSRILLVETDAGRGPSLVLKRVSAAWDWLMRATDDQRCRSVTLWQRGILDRLPPMIEHAVLACAADGDGHAILMRDLGAALVANTRFTPAANRAFLAAMAAMHATFLADPALHEEDLGLCTLAHVYGMFSPHTGQREAGGPDEVPRRILEGWGLLPEVVEPEVAEVVLRLAHDPAPLCAALARYPFTLVHGDWRHANQGLLRDEGGGPPRVVLLDWQLAAAAPPAVELGRYLGANSALLPGPKEETLEYYRACLAGQPGARFDEQWWRPQLELGLLGGFVQDGWAIALKATRWHIGADARDHWRADLQWWAARTRAGMRWL